MVARILVIEDDADSRDLFMFLFEKAGYVVLGASDGLGGLESAGRHQPDVIICDLQMPGIDGFEFARRLRADARWRRVPMIACSAFSMRGDRERALAAGFDGYFAKPIRPESFVQEVAQYIPPALRAAPRPRDL